jgi:hypothetical protein
MENSNISILPPTLMKRIRLGTVLSGAFSKLMVSQFGTDQSEMHRFLTVNSLRKARFAFVTSLLVATLIGSLIFFEGVVLYSFYEQRDQTDIPSNEVFIRFVFDELSVGFRGCLIAALFVAECLPSAPF